MLFTGTGCQIKGLKAYLGKEYDNLFCQDIACHGVASPLLLEKYLHMQKKKYKSNIKTITFRDKSSGWKNYSVKIEFCNGKTYSKPARDDIYMKAFLSDLYLRPSCYNCPAKGRQREADITLADCWGINEIKPEFDDDRGCSLAIIHSQKGMSVLQSLHDKIEYKELNFEAAVQYNSAIITSTFCPEKREDFIKDVQKNFTGAIKRYCRTPIVLLLKIKVYEIVKSVLKKKY